SAHHETRRGKRPSGQPPQTYDQTINVFFIHPIKQITGSQHEYRYFGHHHSLGDQTIPIVCTVRNSGGNASAISRPSPNCKRAPSTLRREKETQRHRRAKSPSPGAAGEGLG
ncbi:MAG: hypothetical protein ACR2J8_13100, partial [Thermomicrobiales bacterium]